MLRSLFGGRPMTFIDEAFYDPIECKMVNHYVDRLGRFWLANTPWSWFRVPTENPNERT